MYNKKLLTFTFCLITASTLILVLPSCSEDCPVCPESEEETRYKGWLFFTELAGFDEARQWHIYKLDMETDSVVDSIRNENIPHGYGNALGMDAASDGSFLAAAFDGFGIDPVTRIYDVNTLQLLHEFDWIMVPFFDVEEGILLGNEANRLTIFELPDFQQVYQDSHKEFHAKFVDRKKKLIYGYHNAGMIYVFNYISKQIVDSIWVDPEGDGKNYGIYDFVIPSESDILYYKGFSNTLGSHVGAWNFKEKRLEYHYRCFTPFGFIELSPDGKELYMTDPGDYTTYENYGTIFILDAHTGSYLNGISLFGYSEIPRESLPGGEIVFSPTGETVYVGLTPFIFNRPTGSLLVIDYKERHIRKLIHPDMKSIPFVLRICPKR